MYTRMRFTCIFVKHHLKLTGASACDRGRSKRVSPVQNVYQECFMCYLTEYQAFYITDRSNAVLLWWFLLLYVLVFKIFVLLAPYVCLQSKSLNNLFRSHSIKLRRKTRINIKKYQ